jgi:carboxypeptidase PM20D1
MRNLLLMLAAAFVLPVGFGAIGTVRYVTTPSPVPPAAEVDLPEGAAERLAGAIRIPTISGEDPAEFDALAFRTLHRYLQGAFPRVHAQLRRETVASHSLLYTWQGSDASLRPILLIGHMDVVPIEPGTNEKWGQDPFGGRVADGFIWGRGAIDNKSAVLGTLEAVEMLLGEGFHPHRTVYLAYGHDEELGGMRGAREIAALLYRRGIQLELVLDEGGVIGEGILPRLSQPVALVGIAEKGFVSLQLSTLLAGGHSSLPPKQTAVGILSAAIARIEENPMRGRLDGATRQLFDRIGPRLSVVHRAVFANLWLTRLFVIRSLAESPATNAMTRTTAAPTVFQAGTKDNVLPGTATALVNVRILPGDSIASVVKHVTRVIDDERVEIRIAGRFSSEPSPISSTDSEAFRMLERTIRSVTPEAIVAPYLVVVATDARHYSALSRNVFRFLPLRLTRRDLERMHGVDERIGIRKYQRAIRTYRQVVVEAAGGRGDRKLDR